MKSSEEGLENTMISFMTDTLTLSISRMFILHKNQMLFRRQVSTSSNAHNLVIHMWKLREFTYLSWMEMLNQFVDLEIENNFERIQMEKLFALLE